MQSKYYNYQISQCIRYAFFLKGALEIAVHLV